MRTAYRTSKPHGALIKSKKLKEPEGFKCTKCTNVSAVMMEYVDPVFLIMFIFNLGWYKNVTCLELFYGKKKKNENPISLIY